MKHAKTSTPKDEVPVIENCPSGSSSEPAPKQDKIELTPMFRRLVKDDLAAIRRRELGLDQHVTSSDRGLLKWIIDKCPDAFDTSTLIKRNNHTSMLSRLFSQAPNKRNSLEEHDKKWMKQILGADRLCALTRQANESYYLSDIIDLRLRGWSYEEMVTQIWMVCKQIAKWTPGMLFEPECLINPKHLAKAFEAERNSAWFLMEKINAQESRVVGYSLHLPLRLALFQQVKAGRYIEHNFTIKDLEPLKPGVPNFIYAFEVAAIPQLYSSLPSSRFFLKLERFFQDLEDRDYQLNYMASVISSIPGSSDVGITLAKRMGMKLGAKYQGSPAKHPCFVYTREV